MADDFKTLEQLEAFHAFNSVVQEQIDALNKKIANAGDEQVLVRVGSLVSLRVTIQLQQAIIKRAVEESERQKDLLQGYLATLDGVSDLINPPE